MKNNNPFPEFQDEEDENEDFDSLDGEGVWTTAEIMYKNGNIKEYIFECSPLNFAALWDQRFRRYFRFFNFTTTEFVKIDKSQVAAMSCKPFRE